MGTQVFLFYKFKFLVTSFVERRFLYRLHSISSVGEGLKVGVERLAITKWCRRLGPLTIRRRTDYSVKKVPHTIKEKH